jgi:hypothetical protein
VGQQDGREILQCLYSLGRALLYIQDAEGAKLGGLWRISVCSTNKSPRRI